MPYVSAGSQRTESSAPEAVQIAMFYFLPA